MQWRFVQTVTVDAADFGDTLTFCQHHEVNICGSDCNVCHEIWITHLCTRQKQLLSLWWSLDFVVFDQIPAKLKCWAWYTLYLRKRQHFSFVLCHFKHVNIQMLTLSSKLTELLVWLQTHVILFLEESIFFIFNLILFYFIFWFIFIYLFICNVKVPYFWWRFVICFCFC